MDNAVVSRSPAPNRAERRRQQREEKRQQQRSWRKMFKSLFPSVGMTLALLSPTAHAGGSCEALLAQGYKNIASAVSEEDRSRAAYHTFCSESYSLASSSSKLKLDGAYKVIKIGLGLEENDTQVAWTKYCQLNHDIGIDKRFSSSHSETIHTESLQAYNECTALTNRGLHADIDISQSETSVTVDLFYTGPVPIGLTGIAQPELGQADCYLAGQKKPLKANFSRRLTAKKLSFTCTRQFTQSAANEVSADWTRIAFQTDDGTLTVDFAPLTLGSYDVKKIVGLTNEISTPNALVGQLETENQQLEQDLAAEKAAPNVEWVATTNAPCESACAAQGLTAVISGHGSGGFPGANQPYHICAVNAHGQGYRAGFNQQPHWANACWVAWGDKTWAMTNYICLCEK